MELLVQDFKSKESYFWSLPLEDTVENMLKEYGLNEDFLALTIIKAPCNLTRLKIKSVKEANVLAKRISKLDIRKQKIIEGLLNHYGIDELLYKFEQKEFKFYRNYKENCLTVELDGRTIYVKDVG